jgi:hypothetical protein
MIPLVVCDCGARLDYEGDVEWHRTTPGHVWNKLKKEMDGNYVYTKRKIPEDAICDICNDGLVKGKRGPKCFIVDNKNKLTVRCKKCKKERQFRAKGHGKVKIN